MTIPFFVLFVSSVALNCPRLKSVEHLDMNCSHPWGPFSYGSVCHFRCTEGYELNGTSGTQCQPSGRWSSEMPDCQGTYGSFSRDDIPSIDMCFCPTSLSREMLQELQHHWIHMVFLYYLFYTKVLTYEYLSYDPTLAALAYKYSGTWIGKNHSKTWDCSTNGSVGWQQWLGRIGSRNMHAHIHSTPLSAQTYRHQK